MSRLTDEQVRAKGTAVVVNSVEDLQIYHGKIKPVFSAPCENWFEDNAPLTAVPNGYIAVRQLSSGCLAFLAKNKLEALDCSKNDREELDLLTERRERSDRSEKRRWWPWAAEDLMDLIFSIFKPW